MKRLCTIMAVTALALPAAGVANAQTTLKFSAVGAPKDAQTVALKDMETYIEENSEIEVDVFDSATLVKQGQQTQALDRGTVDVAYLAPTWIAKKLPAWDILAVPYLLTGPDHVCAVRHSSVWGQMVSEVEDEMGAKLLGMAYQGVRTLNLREAQDVETPADLEGFKFRVVPSPINIAMGEALGTNPTPVPFSELYLALQTGTVDGQDNPLPITYNNKFHEVTEQITLTNHKVLVLMPAISLKTWDKLNEEQRAVVQEAAVQAVEGFTNSVVEKEASLRATLEEEEGMIFTEPDREAFRQASLEYFQDSDFADHWKEGMFDRIAQMDIPADCQS